MTQKILLIGGGGYIGTMVAKDFANRGFKVKIYDNFIYDNNIYKKNRINNLEVFNGDIRNQIILDQHLKDTDHVVILAGLVGDPITKKYPEESTSINLNGIKNIFHLANGKGINKIIFVSTCSNYGHLDNNIEADENTILKPLSLYAKHKVQIEKHIMSLKEKVDYCPTILRFATAFGVSDRMRFDLTVNDFTYEIFCGNELSVYDENTWRPYCHVKDFARLLKKVIDAPKDEIKFEIFNAGDNANQATKKQIVEKIQNYLPKINVQYSKNGSDPRNYKVNFDKVKNVLNFSSSYSIQDGIEEIIKYLQDENLETIRKNRNYYGNYFLKK